MPKLRLLVLVGNYLPGYKAGGQLRTVCNFTELFGDQFEISIITSDRDIGDSVPYPGITADTWINVGKARVRYMPGGKPGLMALARLMNETPHDVLYLNSFFSPSFSILPQLAMRLGLARRTPVVLAPRGEFSDGAIHLKTARKKAYIAFYKACLYSRTTLFQASSDWEEAEIRERLGTAMNVMVAQDIVNVGSSVASAPVESSARDLRICFISRISPKKNLAYALSVLSSVKAPVVFDIYGPVEDQPYWAECLKHMERLPDNVKASYKGPLEYQSVGAAFSTYDMFLFPTRGENFGHVVVESMLAGTPVMIADTTPWKNLEESGSGWVLPLDDAGAWAARIDAFASTDAATRHAARQRVCEYAKRVSMDEAVVEANRSLFLIAAGEKSR